MACTAIIDLITEDFEFKYQYSTILENWIQMRIHVYAFSNLQLQSQHLNKACFADLHGCAGGCRSSYEL